MPRGQYLRKPRQPVEAVMDEGVRTVQPPTEDALVAQAMDNPFWRAAQEKEAEKAAIVPPAPAEPDHDSFDDWMDEPVPVAPDDSMVSRKVRTWAGSVCAIQHGVTWAPINDGSALEVVLTTIHGTSVMRKPAGQWSEADVDFALEAMRDDLKV